MYMQYFPLKSKNEYQNRVVFRETTDLEISTISAWEDDSMKVVQCIKT